MTLAERKADAMPMNDAAPLTHLDRLEAEAVSVLREVAAEFHRPVLLYSIGKDSSVLLHLAIKAFWPAPPPFPLLHIDTGWKFAEMIRFRDRAATKAGMKLIVHTNPEGADVTPFSHSASVYTNVAKTQALRQALDASGFDAAFGGARRDEEASRAKERIFSFRSAAHGWDPKNQRPEPWGLLNARIGRGESVRAFPLSNWTELDVWHYIAREGIETVPLYLAAPRPVVRRGGQWIMLDDDRLPLKAGEVPQTLSVRFRTLGCYPLTAAVESTADTLPALLAEMAGTRLSERAGRLIDHGDGGSMEAKKREGYF